MSDGIMKKMAADQPEDQQQESHGKKKSFIVDKYFIEIEKAWEREHGGYRQKGMQFCVAFNNKKQARGTSSDH